MTCTHTAVICCTSPEGIITVSAVSNETLQELLTRRLTEMGRTRRGREHEPLSLLEAYQATPAPEVTYEAVRRVLHGHSRIGARTARTLATMLDVPLQEVEVAAGSRPTRERFELPERADRLHDLEREVVVAVVDAILNARNRGEGAPATVVVDEGDVMVPGESSTPRGSTGRRRRPSPGP